MEGDDDGRGEDDDTDERGRPEDLPPEVLAGQRHAALRPRGLQLDIAGTGNLMFGLGLLISSKVKVITSK